jgi:membrane-associated phospholipid phosphatase
MNDTTKTIRRYPIFFAGYFLLLIAGCIFLAVVGKRSSFLFFNTIHTPFANTFFTYYTYAGDGIFAILVLLFYFFVLRKKQDAVALLTAYISSGLMAQLIKNLVFSPRPKTLFQATEYQYFIEGVTHGGNSSFPSGHTATAFAMATVLVIISNNKKWQLPLLIAATLEAFSRMYLGQHFLGDVLFGSFLGVVCGLLSMHYTKNAKALQWTFNKKAATATTKIPNMGSTNPL